MKETVIITGPSSVGKSTYAKKYYTSWDIIESDGILWDKLSNMSENRQPNYPYRPIRKKVEEKIYQEMYNESIDKQRVVFVVNDEKPLKDILDNKHIDHKIILIGTNLTRLVKNVNMRKDRPISGVLSDYSKFFKPANGDKIDNNDIYVRKSSLDKFENVTSKDEKNIEKFKNKYFPNDTKTNYVEPVNYYKYLVIII